MRTATQNRAPLKQVIAGILILGEQVQQDTEKLVGHEAEARKLIERAVEQQGWSLSEVASALDQHHAPAIWRWETGIDLLIGRVH